MIKDILKRLMLTLMLGLFSWVMVMKPWEMTEGWTQMVLLLFARVTAAIAFPSDASTANAVEDTCAKSLLLICIISSSAKK